MKKNYFVHTQVINFFFFNQENCSFRKNENFLKNSKNFRKLFLTTNFFFSIKPGKNGNFMKKKESY